MDHLGIEPRTFALSEQLATTAIMVQKSREPDSNQRLSEFYLTYKLLQSEALTGLSYHENRANTPPYTTS